MNEGRDPQTPQEWQEAVDAARYGLLVDAAEQYGLVTGPVFDIERCMELLRRGEELGYTPKSDHELLASG